MENNQKCIVPLNDKKCRTSIMLSCKTLCSRLLHALLHSRKARQCLGFVPRFGSFVLVAKPQPIQFPRYPEFAIAHSVRKSASQTRYRSFAALSSGFTLAEIMVVLVILGVLAAITMSISIQNVQKRETLTRFRRAYSLLVDITERSRVENGYPPEGISNETLFNTYFRPYLSISRECGNVWGNKRGNDRCFAGPNGMYGDFYQVILKNGMSLGVRRKAGFGGIMVIVDINGPKKGYSKLGQDTFFFTWASEGQLSCGVACIPHQTSVPELIPGGLDWYANPFFYDSPMWDIVFLC